jgi:hypothetical protein
MRPPVPAPPQVTRAQLMAVMGGGSDTPGPSNLAGLLATAAAGAACRSNGGGVGSGGGAGNALAHIPAHFGQPQPHAQPLQLQLTHAIAQNQHQSYLAALAQRQLQHEGAVPAAARGADSALPAAPGCSGGGNGGSAGGCHRQQHERQLADGPPPPLGLGVREAA